MSTQNSSVVEEPNEAHLEVVNQQSLEDKEKKETNIDSEDVNDNNSDPEDEWLDILGSGQLMKKIIKKGQDDARPQRSDVCTVKFVGKLDDKVVDENLVTINLGDAEVIQGLDFALPLMNLEEEAEIIVGPRFAYGSLGRHPDIPPDATLHYYVTLISAQPEQPVETLPLTERKSIGNRKKERGNYWYVRQDYTLAIQCYRRALEYLDDIGLTCSDGTEDDYLHSMLEERIKVYNNLAASQMKIKAFDTALQSIDNVLRCQPNNLKALFRKGKVLAEKGDTEEAICLLKKVLALENDNIQAKNELNQLLARKKKDTDVQKNLYKKMLGTKQNGGQTTEVDLPSPNIETRRWGLVVGFIGALVSFFVAYKYYRPV